MNEQHKARLSFRNHKTRASILLLTLTLTAALLAYGIAAKYVFGGTFTDQAQVGTGGTVTLRVWEYEITPINGEYKLGTDVKYPGAYNAAGYEEEGYISKQVTYDAVLPGVDIAKKLFVDLKAEDIPDGIKYELYLQITKTNWPTYTVVNDANEETQEPAITYDLGDDWAEVSDGLYKYVGTTYAEENDEGLYILSPNEKTMKILEKGIIIPVELVNDRLTVSQYYDPYNKGNFSLTFKAYLKQVSAQNQS